MSIERIPVYRHNPAYTTPQLLSTTTLAVRVSALMDRLARRASPHQLAAVLGSYSSEDFASLSLRWPSGATKPLAG